MSAPAAILASSVSIRSLAEKGARYRFRGSRVAEKTPVGARFGLLTVTSEPFTAQSGLRVQCKCDCGGSSTPRIYNLVNGTTKSCGCQKTVVMLRAPQPNRYFSPDNEDAARILIDSCSTPEPNTGCWLWTESVDSDGYGRARYRRREIKAHRLSYIVHCQQVPNGLFVLHGCDTRCCVNPRHLSIGTAAENSAQMVQRGRSYSPAGDRHYTARIGSVNKGEKNPRAKLSAQDVLEIRASCGSNPQIASRYGVSPATVRLIRLRKIWRHL